MFKKKRNRLRVVIPSSLSDITLSQYQEYKILKEEDTQEYYIKTLQILCKGDTDMLGKFTHKSIIEAYTKLQNTLNGKNDTKEKFIFSIQGVKYGLIPNFEKMSLDEVADIETYYNDGEWENMHKILAIIYRPIVQESSGKYTIQPYLGTEGRAEIFKRWFPLEVLHGVLVFFWNIEREFIQNSSQYSSMMKSQKLRDKSKPILIKKLNGAGTT